LPALAVLNVGELLPLAIRLNGIAGAPDLEGSDRLQQFGFQMLFPPVFQREGKQGSADGETGKMLAGGKDVT